MTLPRLEKLIRHMKETYGVEVYLEPGEAVALNAGYLVTEVHGHREKRHRDVDFGRFCGLPYAGCAGNAIPAAS